MFHAFSPVWRSVSAMQRMVDDLVEHEFTTLTPPSTAALNLYASEDSVVVLVQAPGIDASSLDCTVVGDALTISGRRGEAEQGAGSSGDDAGWQRRERSSESFRRTVTLPYPVDAERTQAVLTNGLLTLTLHRRSSDKPRKIAVEAA